MSSEQAVRQSTESDRQTIRVQAAPAWDSLGTTSDSKRLAFCREHENDQWSKTIYTDESRFVTSPDSPLIPWVKKGDDIYVESDKFPASFMVGAGSFATRRRISANTQTDSTLKVVLSCWKGTALWILSGVVAKMWSSSRTGNDATLPLQHSAGWKAKTSGHSTGRQTHPTFLGLNRSGALQSVSSSNASG